ncbi:MAG TPA: S8 family serine peptidase [Cyclobacteriaceae bacterium]
MKAAFFRKGAALGLAATLFAILHTQAQQPQHTLTQIATDRSQYNLSQLEKAKAYAAANNLPMQFRDANGNYVYMIGLDELSGRPVYITTFNAGAAITTGVNAVRAGGPLGLNLEGEGIIFGVWDSGLVKDHVEFASRILTRQGTELSDHSTHVAGTLAATGIDPAAKGMAPKAQLSLWDFINDDAEMANLAKPDQTSLLFSNHSYGVVLGFLQDENGWSWTGNSSISTQEDYRFGFYTSKSRTIDQIAFNAPYYTIVWAAGNDRSDNGDGTHPADGNGGTGFDSIGPEGCAKNNITVGAILKVPNYTGPSSVVMSGFSSWGPTDDGRIKPDLVAAGVSIYSTGVTSSGQDTYSFVQGTSLAAPNVTGSLGLLQELYRDLHAGNYMKAATLKALAIHTARESGLNPGPDYSFGWGLLNVGAAAEVLLAQDQESTVILENTLMNGDVFQYTFEPESNTKVTATIVWTDPPGSPVAPQLDPATPMLVNDLDIRIFDSGGNEVLPWTLNPNSPSSPAVRGNNTRDNVEKIEFDQPEPRLYTLEVSHKGQLQNGRQDYSLILTFTAANNPKTAYYWIGNSGNWNDPSNWSLSSGGAPANQVPDANARVVIDENSFSAANQSIALTADAACASLTWLAKSAASLSLNNHTLEIDGNFVVSSTGFSVSTPGTIGLIGSGSPQNQLNLSNSDLSKATLLINSPAGATWTVNGAIKAGTINVQQGGLVARNATLNVGVLNATTTGEKTIDLSNTTVSGLTSSTMNGANLTLESEGSVFNFVNSGAATINWSGVAFDGSVNTNGSDATISGGTSIADLTVGGSLTLLGNNTIGAFKAQPGASLAIGDGSTQNLTSAIELNADAGNRISLTSTGAGSATLNFSGHFKRCFDFLDVTRVNVNGDVVISAGANSTLTSATNWVAGACAEALFADFSFKFNCEGSLTEFTDASDGNITSWSWDFGDPGSGDNTSSEQDPFHIYNSTDTYSVTVTVSDGSEEVSYTRDVPIINNNLPDNRVIIANEKLFSELTAEFYQWFKDGERLESETSRSYAYGGAPGSYFVVIKNNTCNLPSSVFLITATEPDEPAPITQIKVYPNPVDAELIVEAPGALLPADVTIVNTLGQVVFSGAAHDDRMIISTSGLGNGMYFVDIRTMNSTVRKKIIVRH